MLVLDYSLETPQERNEYVTAYIESMENPPNERQLELMADYICFAFSREENDREINTPNRMVTVNKRETSYEGIIAKLEGGEDSIYNITCQNKNLLLSPQVSITKKDIEEVPGLKELRDAIENWEKILGKVKGKARYVAKKTIIQLRQDQYTLKNSFYQPIQASNIGRCSTKYDFNEDTGYWDGDEYVHLSYNKIDFRDKRCISGLLQNYQSLKAKCEEEIDSDLKWILYDLDQLIDQTITGDYKLILDMKINGDSNQEIQETLGENSFTQEYISALWRNKIPSLIADRYRENWLNWVFTYRLKGEYKTCTRCGETKLAHNRYFSQNRGVHTRFYSICKACRNKKAKEDKGGK